MKPIKFFLILIFLTLGLFQYTCGRSIEHINENGVKSITTKPIIPSEIVISHEELKDYKLVSSSSIEKGQIGVIYVVENSNGEKFIIKQIKKERDLYTQFDIVTEFLGCYMAEKAGLVCVNKARIIPQGTNLFGLDPDWPSLLISFFEGHRLVTRHRILPKFIKKLFNKKYRDEEEANKTFVIYQQARYGGHAKKGEFYPDTKLLPKVQRGLTRIEINHLTTNPNLPIIAALDTFVGNMDRWNGNLLFNPKDKLCYAIDMGVIIF